MKGLNANEQYNDGVTVNLKAYIKKEIRDYMIKVAN
jgi:hypothetical protein